MRVDVHRLRDPADLVRERDLDGMERVACVLERFGGSGLRHDELTRKVLEHLPQHSPCALRTRSNYGERRVVVVANRGSFSQELRLEAQREVDVATPSRRAFEDFTQLAVDRAKTHRGAHDHNMKAIMVAQTHADLFRDAQDSRLVLLAVDSNRWSSNADERNIRISNRTRRIRDYG